MRFLNRNIYCYIPLVSCSQKINESKNGPKRPRKLNTAVCDQDSMCRNISKDNFTAGTHGFRCHVHAGLEQSSFCMDETTSRCKICQTVRSKSFNDEACRKAKRLGDFIIDSFTA